MKRRILALMLAAGAFWGFATGFASLHDAHGGPDGWRSAHCPHAPPPATPAEPGR
ncbi:MAG: hypothetical protein H6737_29470 [Alphaproteobacteria bacterium]|nr:hypothetical protein [Alphaproteobacteria bacterium]